MQTLPRVAVKEVRQDGRDTVCRQQISNGAVVGQLEPKDIRNHHHTNTCSAMSGNIKEAWMNVSDSRCTHADRSRTWRLAR